MCVCECVGSIGEVIFLLIAQDGDTGFPLLLGNFLWRLIIVWPGERFHA